MEEGGTAIISGGPGSGKTTLCLKLKPTRFASSEQELELIHKAWWRVVGQHDPRAEPPIYSQVKSWEELEEDCVGLSSSDRLVLDSVSQLAGGPEIKAIMTRVIERIRAAGALAFFIAQYTKDQTMLGPNMLNHLVDVVCQIPPDPSGMRRLAVDKNRYGDVYAKYFQINDAGVEPILFNDVYTVEGPPGQYRLLMYPQKSRGSDYSGTFKLLEESGVMGLSGCATAAIPCRLYRSGFAVPLDVERRRVFAEDHGLTWLDTEDLGALLSMASPDEPSSAERIQDYLDTIRPSPLENPPS